MMEATNNILRLRIIPCKPNKKIKLNVVKATTITEAGLLVPTYSFEVDDEVFPVTETTEWNLSSNRNFTYQATTIYAETIANYTHLPIVLSSMIAQFSPFIDEQIGINILDKKYNPNTFVVIGGCTLDSYIKDEIWKTVSPMILVKEVNAKNGTLDVIPLSRVEYSVSRIYYGKTFSYDFKDQNPDLSIQHPQQTVFYLSFSLFFKGNRNEYKFESKSINKQLIPSENVILKILSETLEYYNAIKIGCGTKIITLGTFVKQLPKGMWYYDK